MSNFENALVILFNIIKNEIFTPLLNALSSTNVFSNVIDFLNNFLNGLFNLKRENIVTTNYVNVELLADVGALLFFILSIYFIFNIFKFVFDFILKLFKNSININTNKRGKKYASYKKNYK